MNKIIEDFTNNNGYEPCSEKNFLIKETRFLPPPTHAVSPPVHRHPYYEIIFVTQGKGDMQIDFQHYPIQQGSLFFFSPAQMHFPTVDEEFNCFLLRFDLSVFSENNFFHNLSMFNFDYLHIQDQNYKDVEQILIQLHEEFTEHRTLKQSAICNLLKILLITLQRLFPKVVNSTTQTSLFSALNQLLEKNHYQIAHPSEYAKPLKVPMKVLNTVIKEFTGMSCGEYIRSKTLIEAKRLLLYSTKNANEIAYELGFVDTSYFSRFFKKETGVSPMTFRKISL
ncbi:MAG: helix-turn-helix domain-containing protein [Sulfurospirillaceae bacterium]|nr:helix-turn-helix domain-containing protein [Sulfurospirillaceae bacterium]MDD2826781.1 helix-turn-helix domain-containing protein [Sulfurospirillaceae bacterium]